jgi:hypothetical protein
MNEISGLQATGWGPSILHTRCKTGQVVYVYVYYTLPNWNSSEPGRVYGEGDNLEIWLEELLVEWLVQGRLVQPSKLSRQGTSRQGEVVCG